MNKANPFRAHTMVYLNILSALAIVPTVDPLWKFDWFFLLWTTKEDILVLVTSAETILKICSLKFHRRKNVIQWLSGELRKWQLEWSPVFCFGFTFSLLDVFLMGCWHKIYSCIWKQLESVCCRQPSWPIPSWKPLSPQKLFWTLLLFMWTVIYIRGCVWSVTHFLQCFRLALGHGKNHKDAASVRATHPIPAACGIYYFEVKIVSKGRDG